MGDARDRYIGQVVAGRSFADVGGLWGTVNEKVSVAHRSGARGLTMIDITPEGNELWRAFEDRRRALKVPEVSCIAGDVVALAAGDQCPRFHVVHCSGILYHLPDPMRLLVALRRLTREYLVLTSVVTATRVESGPGTLELPRAAVLFVPALEGRERAILAARWRPFVGDGAIGLTTEPPAWRPDDFAPWWWLPTVEGLKAMCRAAGFRCEAGDYFWNGNAYVQLLGVEA